MSTQIELLILDKWIVVAIVKDLNQRILDAIIDSYSHVDAFRIRFDGVIYRQSVVSKKFNSFKNNSF